MSLRIAVIGAGMAGVSPALIQDRRRQECGRLVRMGQKPGRLPFTRTGRPRSFLNQPWAPAPVGCSPLAATG
jgi:hypothetical protein